jgi:hypothetical protein
MDYIHTTNGGCKEFHQSKVMVFHPGGESCSVPAKDHGTPGHDGIAIDQVSKYRVPRRSVPGDGSWRAHARKALTDASSLWVLGLLSCSSLPTRRLLMVQTFIYPAVMYGAEVWDTTKAVQGKMSAVVRKLSR